MRDAEEDMESTVKRMQRKIDDARAHRDEDSEIIRKLRKAVKDLKTEILNMKDGRGGGTAFEDYIFYKNEYTVAHEERERLTEVVRDLTQEYHLVIDMLTVAKLDTEKMRQAVADEQLKSKALSWEISRLRDMRISNREVNK